jgi:transcriptional regulator with XRE-family HTH domain
VTTRKNDITIRQIALETGVDEAVVRDILREKPDLDASRETLDRVYKTARKLGYDFRKLKIGKRMQHRKELLDEILEKLAEKPAWSRADIEKFLKTTRELMDRVHNRVFREEFGQPGR